MAYDAAYLLCRASPSPNGAADWVYRDTVAAATVIAAGYISDGGKRGVKVGDTIEYNQMDSQSDPTSNTAKTIHRVTAVNATTGGLTLSAGVVVT